MQKYFTYLITVIILLFFAFCKDDNKNRDKEVQILRQSLSLMIEENNRITIDIENKYAGNAGVEPYFHFSKRLNNYINSVIDTSFKNIETDTLKIKSKLNIINKKYREIIDSISSKYKFQLFLLSDDSLLRKPFCEYPGYFQDEVVGHYILMQRILQRHLNVIKICRGSFGEMCIHHTKSEDSEKHSHVDTIYSDKNNICFTVKYTKRSIGDYLQESQDSYVTTKDSIFEYEVDLIYCKPISKKKAINFVVEQAGRKEPFIKRTIYSLEPGSISNFTSDTIVKVYLR